MNPASNHSRRAAMAARPLLAGLAVFACVWAPGAGLRAQDVPASPDQIKFPPLQYAPPKPSDYRVKLSNGMVAYLVPDRSLPLVNVHVLMRVGPDLDPMGKEGLAAMTMDLLTSAGTARMTATQLEDRVNFLGAQLGSGLGGGGGGGPFGPSGPPVSAADGLATLNLLSKDIDEGLQLLVDCLKTPAFQEDRLALNKEQALQGIKTRNDDSQTIESYQWKFLVAGEEHWSNRYITQSSIQAITRADLIAFHKRYVGPKNFLLAVSGDFDRGAMIKKLEAGFAKWPNPGERPGPPTAPAQPMAHGWYMTDKDVNQGRVSIGFPGLQREDPDVYAARVMNDILGGGGFTSRLTNRIRSDEGLAYQVSSRLGDGIFYPEPWRLVFQSKVRSVAYASQIALEELRRMRDSLVTPEELEGSKSKFIEAFPTQFATAAAIAGTLAAEELSGRYARLPDYFATYRDKIKAVTQADVQRVARRLLDPDKLLALMVGNAGDMLQGDPKFPAQLSTLAKGEPQRLPLRDPLTMKVVANP